MEVIVLLTGKALKTILRQQPVALFLLLSTVSVFSALYFLYYISRGSFYQYSSSVS
jgi:hypothetical protein